MNDTRIESKYTIVYIYRCKYIIIITNEPLDLTEFFIVLALQR